MDIIEELHSITRDYRKASGCDPSKDNHILYINIEYGDRICEYLLKTPPGYVCVNPLTGSYTYRGLCTTGSFLSSNDVRNNSLDMDFMGCQIQVAPVTELTIYNKDKCIKYTKSSGLTYSYA